MTRNLQDLSTAQRALWDAYRATQPEDIGPRFLEAFHFCDNAADADELAALVEAGTKRATAALVAAHTAERVPLPQPGALSIVTDFAGQPRCIIRTQRVDVMPFSQVDAAFAATEGEGDGSLAFWQRAHRAFFGRECARLGIAWHDEQDVVCERFELVWRAEAVAPAP
ncbi:MAG: ASCH domain-containing protein [Aquabacterium sp.]